MLNAISYKWLENERVWGIFINSERIYENEYIADREDLLEFIENELAPCIIIVSERK